MRLTFERDRVLAVMAHPDDAELLCAGTLARAKADGAAIAICVMCCGDKGVGSASGNLDLAEIRHEEASAAAKVIGAELYWQGARDGELFDTYDQRLALVQTYRKFRPTLVIAHAAEDYHPDHRAASVLAEAATWLAASRGHVTEGFEALDGPPALWWADTIDMNGFEPAFYVDVTAHMDAKTRMLECHRTQLGRGGDRDFAPLSPLIIRQAEARGAQAQVPAAEAFRPHPAFKRLRAW
jgi:LmbE family N-acetylglucosaminyl deacetylase